MLLAFDTATAAVTVALHDGTRLLAEHTVVDARRHGELLSPAIAQVLGRAEVAPSDLTGIAVGVGPGPFTGLRVGLMTARVMADALAIPVSGVCTLDVLAADVLAADVLAADVLPAHVVSGQPFLIATDARRREIYWAVYGEAGARLDGPYVGRAADLGWRGPAFGSGALLYADAFDNASQPEFPRAATLAHMVACGSAKVLPPDPLYLRRPDAVEPGARKAVTPA